jgi:ERF superfamily
MKTSENIGAIAAALSKAQSELKNIEKSKINPHLKSKYADIADGLEVIRPILSKNGIALVQATNFNGDTGIFSLNTRLIHTSGEWIESSYPLPSSGRATEIGAAITYARRYSAFALVAVAGTDEDADGSDAADTKPQVAKKKTSDPEVLKTGQEIAKNGSKALREWWPSLTKEQRTSLTAADIAALKKQAEEAEAEKVEA